MIARRLSCRHPSAGGLPECEHGGVEYDPTQYLGAAPYCLRGRPGYSADLASGLPDELGLDGTGHLVDVGSRPGTVGAQLAGLFDHVTLLTGNQPRTGRPPGGTATSLGIRPWVLASRSRRSPGHWSPPPGCLRVLRRRTTTRATSRTGSTRYTSFASAHWRPAIDRCGHLPWCWAARVQVVPSLRVTAPFMRLIRPLG